MYNEFDIVTGNKNRFLNNISVRLKQGNPVLDEEFDLVYPPGVRKLSEDHWTPVEVAVRAAELLAPNSNYSVLDVGSGCGKFCTVAGLSSRADFAGIEQRPHLVTVARDAIKKFKSNNITFNLGNMTEFNWSQFDSFYLFNPFYENRLKLAKLDETIILSHEKYDLYVNAVNAKLSQAKLNTRVVTYHGYGGQPPDSYKLKEKEESGSHYLELWIKEKH